MIFIQIMLTNLAIGQRAKSSNQVQGVAYVSARNDAKIIIAAGCCFPAPRMPRLPSGCRCNNLKSHNKATYCLRRWRCPRGSNNNYFSLDLAGDVARIEFFFCRCPTLVSYFSVYKKYPAERLD